MHAITEFKRYFEFSGRSARAAYWQFIALAVVASVVMMLIDMARVGSYGTPYAAFAAIAVLIMPVYSATVRRLHDRNYSGGWTVAQWAVNLTGLGLNGMIENDPYSDTVGLLSTLRWITVIGNLAISGFLLSQLAQKGEETENRFGPPPGDAVGAAAVPLEEKFARPSIVTPATVAPQRSQPLAIPKPGTGDGDILDRIERLGKLKADGLLTEEEFDAQKALLLYRS